MEAIEARKGNQVASLASIESVQRLGGLGTVAYLEGLREGVELAASAAQLTQRARKHDGFQFATAEHERIACLLEPVYRSLGFDVRVGGPALVSFYDRTYRKDGTLGGLNPVWDRRENTLSAGTLVRFFDQTELRGDVSRWAIDVEDAPRSCSIAVPILADSPLVVFNLKSRKASGKGCREIRRRWLDRALEKLVEMLTGGDASVPLYVEKNLAGTRARLFAILPDAPDVYAIRSLAERVQRCSSVWVDSACAGSGDIVDLPRPHVFSIAGRYAPGATGHSPLNGRSQMNVDGTVRQFKDVFALFSEMADHLPSAKVTDRLIATPRERERLTPRGTVYIPPTFDWSPSATRQAASSRLSDTPASMATSDVSQLPTSRYDRPTDEKLTSFESLQPEVWTHVYDLGLDLRSGKTKSVCLLPAAPNRQIPRARDLVPDPAGLSWAFHVGERRALVSKERLARSPCLEKPVLGHVIAHVAAQFEASTDDSIGCDEYDLSWTLGGRLFPGSGLLYVELDDHDESTPIEERKDRQQRFLEALDRLLGPDHIVATKHPTIVASGRRGAIGVHAWYAFAFDAQKAALAVLKKDLVEAAGVPEGSVECHSGMEGGATRFIIDPEYAVVRSRDARLTTVRAAHDEIARLRGQKRPLPGRYSLPVEGEAIRRSPARTFAHGPTSQGDRADVVSRLSYGAGGRYRAFFKIAAHAAAVSRSEQEAGDLAWQLAVHCNCGSKDMADASQRPALEADIRRLAAGSFRKYGGRPPEDGEQFVTKDATGDSDPYAKDGFVLPDLLPGEEEALRARVERLAYALLPKRPTYRRAALDAIIKAYRYCLARYLQDKDRKYENEDLQRLNGYATLERNFFITRRGFGVKDPLRCRDVLIAAGLLVEAPASEIDGRTFRWAGRLPHVARHFKVVRPEDTGARSETWTSTTSIGHQVYKRKPGRELAFDAWAGQRRISDVNMTENHDHYLQVGGCASGYHIIDSLADAIALTTCLVEGGYPVSVIDNLMLYISLPLPVLIIERRYESERAYQPATGPPAGRLKPPTRSMAILLEQVLKVPVFCGLLLIRADGSVCTSRRSPDCNRYGLLEGVSHHHPIVCKMTAPIEDGSENAEVLARAGLDGRCI